MELGPYYDPLGEFEMHTTRYKLSVLVPPRPSFRWSLLNFIRTPVSKPPPDNHGTSQQETHTNSNSFYLLSELPRKTITVKSEWFPWQMRCEHIQSKNGFKEGVKGCKEGCYVLERGSPDANWTCADKNCEGHVYCGTVLKDENGRCCFGKKGERMVCRKRVNQD